MRRSRDDLAVADHRGPEQNQRRETDVVMDAGTRRDPGPWNARSLTDEESQAGAGVALPRRADVEGKAQARPVEKAEDADENEILATVLELEKI